MSATKKEKTKIQNLKKGIKLKSNSMIELKILIVDSDTKISGLLKKIIETYSFVKKVDLEDPINVIHRLEMGDFNTIFIDPFARGLEFSSNLIFKIRSEFPKIVFTLFVDFKEIENTNNFYLEQRVRLRHYFNLNKRTPLYLLEGEIVSVLFACQNYLNFDGPEKNIKTIKEKEYNEFKQLSFEIKNLVSEDEISKSLEKMEVYYRDENSEIHKSVLLMKLKIKNANRHKSNDLIDYSSYMKLRMQVANSIIEIINEGNTMKPGDNPVTEN